MIREGMMRRIVIPGAAAGMATSAAAAWRGKHDSDSAIAAINATSHVLWGNRAATVKRVTATHSLPGYFINTAAAIFWTAVFQMLFARLIRRRGAPAALAGAIVTTGVAYVTDYKLVPSRLTPGYEKRLTPRSLWLIYGVLAVSMAAGAIVTRRRSS